MAAQQDFFGMLALNPLLASAIVGTSVGALLTAAAYAVQGGEPWDFAGLGAAAGAFIGIGYASGRVRIPFVGAALGAVAALTLFSTPGVRRLPHQYARGRSCYRSSD